MQDTTRWLAETGDTASRYLEAIQSHIQQMASVNTELRGDLACERARAARLRAAIALHVATGHDQGEQLAAVLVADVPEDVGREGADKCQG